MITQGWPLWAVRKSTGTVYAVIGWDVRQVGMNATRRPIGVKIGAEVDDPVALMLGGPLAFVSDWDAAWKAAGA